MVGTERINRDLALRGIDCSEALKGSSQALLLRRQSSFC
jgi:hypothetical protein